MNIEVVLNRHCNRSRSEHLENYKSSTIHRVVDFHKDLGNKETPLYELPSLAKHVGVGKLFVKDESRRLGLKAFKVLGASYAIKMELERNPQIKTFLTATDGNHGKAVAWMAKILNKNSIIYIPKRSSICRINAIKEEGAQVVVVDGDYDLAVYKAESKTSKLNTEAGKTICSLVQDTAWNSYTQVPLDIMLGYTTQMNEISSQLMGNKVDVVLLQSGVGTWAASVVSYIVSQWTYKPIFISVEPVSSNCLFRSISKGKRVCFNSGDRTSMAGLDCGSVSTIAWDILEKHLTGSISISDDLMEIAIRKLANPIEFDSKIISGESGASTLAALIGLNLSNAFEEFKLISKINNKSSALLISTEGDTDPVNYKKICRG